MLYGRFYEFLTALNVGWENYKCSIVGTYTCSILPTGNSCVLLIQSLIRCLLRRVTRISSLKHKSLVKSSKVYKAVWKRVVNL